MKLWKVSEALWINPGRFSTVDIVQVDGYREIPRGVPLPVGHSRTEKIQGAKAKLQMADGNERAITLDEETTRHFIAEFLEPNAARPAGDL